MLELFDEEELVEVLSVVRVAYFLSPSLIMHRRIWLRSFANVEYSSNKDGNRPCNAARRIFRITRITHGVRWAKG